MNAVWFVLGIVSICCAVLAGSAGEWAPAVGLFAFGLYCFPRCLAESRKLR